MGALGGRCLDGEDRLGWIREWMVGWEGKGINLKTRVLEGKRRAVLWTSMSMVVATRSLERISWFLVSKLHEYNRYPEVLLRSEPVAIPAFVEMGGRNQCESST